MKYKNRFLTIEGIEGVGKSTALAFIQTCLQEQGIPLTVTREPGGTVIAERIRELLLTKQTEPMNQLTELLLMFAARAQHIAQVIQPALQADQWVVCDRFTDASYAYQGAGRGIAIHKIALLEECVHDNLKPDFTLLLDMPENTALERAQKRSEPDRFESEQLAFFKRVREGYLERAHAEPQRFTIVDASQSLAKVQNDIVAWLKKIMTL